IFNTKTRAFNIVSYGANWFDTYEGKLVCGDSASPNVYEILTGLDDLDYPIEGLWETGKDNLKTNQVKKYKRFKIWGLIDPDQIFNIHASFDNDDYEYLGTIEGSGNYVDKSRSNAIGAQTIGEGVIGMGKSAQPYYF